VAAAGSVTTLLLDDNDLHGIKADQITPVSSLKDLYLLKCSLQSDDMNPLLTTVAAAGSIHKVWLNGNNLRGIKGNQMTPVSSLKFLSLNDCGLQNEDLKACAEFLNMLIRGSILYIPPPTFEELREFLYRFPV
jgi:hypothetical protein